MSRVAHAASMVLLAALIFLAGVFAGNYYQVLDFLCPAAASPHRLTQDLVSPEGIVFPGGTLVPLRDCAYMQRFSWSFAIDQAVELDRDRDAAGPLAAPGFSMLSPRE